MRKYNFETQHTFDLITDMNSSEVELVETFQELPIGTIVGIKWQIDGKDDDKIRAAYPLAMPYKKGDKNLIIILFYNTKGEAVLDDLYAYSTYVNSEPKILEVNLEKTIMLFSHMKSILK